MSRTARILTGAIVLMLATPAANAAAAAKVDSALALETYARPGTLVSLETGRKLNIRCFGSGSPTVILTAGAGEQSLTWRSLHAQLVAGAAVEALPATCIAEDVGAAPAARAVGAPACEACGVLAVACPALA
jgi:hypothetical protein